MSKYVILFSKTGTICFTSHLDLMRIFKRAFKRSGIPLAYSQGFNPHPKMGFAQPLSLGYWGMEEYFECETAGEWAPDLLMQRLANGMPEGIALKQCMEAEHLTKTLASHTVAAEYIISIPTEACAQGGDDAAQSDSRILWHNYMDQEEIRVWKRQKKKKEPKLVDIRPMIREITFKYVPEEGFDGILYIDTVLDCGSGSNLSPELIITSVCKRFGILTDRSDVSVMRKKLLFDQPLQKLLTETDP